MNRIYKTLWSASTQSWQAVPENARTGGKKSSSSAAGVVASVALGLALSGAAHAQSPPAVPPAINQLPTGGSVARGTATFSQTATAQAAAMTVNQSSQRAVINWDTFNLGSKSSVNFVQPNAQAVTLNRVIDSNPSQIFGRITANGQVFLTNANGVYFSPTSSVDVGAFTATTHSISDDNFMSGKYVFERNGSTGKVINEGNITAALGGYVALLAPEVQNAGVVVARAGTVAMAAGEMITLTVDNNGSLAGITTTPSTIATLVENKHAVLAPDGQIILSAMALDKLQAGVIKNSGSLEANSISHKGGKIYLEGDDITLTSTSKIEAKGPAGGGTVLVGGDWQGSGDLRQATKVTMEAGATIDASATDNGDGGKVVLWSDVRNADSETLVAGTIAAEGRGDGTRGGQIETSGARLHVADSASIRMGGTGATGGQWLLDPKDFFIAGVGGDITGTALSNQITAGNTVEVMSSSGVAGTNGDIYIGDNLSWNNTGVLKLSAARGIGGTANIAMTGGGTLIFNPAGINAASVYQGVISGTGSFIKDGAGIANLYNTNTYSGTTTVNGGTLNVGTTSVIPSTATLGTGRIISNARLQFLLNGAFTLSSQASNTGAITGTGSVTVASGANNVTIDRDITLSGASSRIYIASNSSYNTYMGMSYSTAYDVTLSNTITTSDTGTITIFTGSPSTVSTSTLMSKMVGATGALKYKNYGSGATLDLSFGDHQEVLGTRNFYYRATAPAVSATGAVVANKVYDGTNDTANASFTGGTVTGAGDGDVLTPIVTGGLYTNTTVGSTLIAGSGGQDVAAASGSGWAVSGYTCTCSITYTGTISAKTLTVSGVTVANKTYNGNNAASFSGGSLVGVVSGETVNLALTGTFSQTGVGTGLAVATTGSLSGATSSNYVLTLPTGVTGNIVAKPLTVSGTSVANKVYDGTNAASLSGGSLVGIVGSENVTLTQAGTFTQTGVGTGIAVTVSDSLGGTAAGNYSLTQPTGVTGNITAKALTVSGTTVANKVYDGTNVASLSGGSLVGILGSDNVTLTQAGAFAQTGVGTGLAVTAADSLGGTAAGNYSLTQPAGLTANITAKTLTVSGTTVANKAYDGTNAATLSSGSLVGVISGDNVTFTQAGTFAQTGVGTGISVTAADSLGGTASGNYVLTQPTGLAANITAKALTVSGTSVANKTYDGTNAASLSGGALVGVVGSDNVTLTQMGTFVSANAGTGVSVTAADTLGGTGAGNYTLTQPTGLTANIGKAPLTVTAADAEKNFGSANPAFSVTVSGYIAGETAATSGVTGKGLATTTATDLTVAGTAPIMASVGTLAATNYAFTRFVDGTLTIKPIAAMNNAEVSTLIGYQLSKLTGAEVASFSATQLQVFSPQQLSSLSPSQLAAMTTSQVLALSPVQIAAINPAKIASMSATDLSAFSNEQLQALSVSQIAAISPDHFAALKPEQIMALSISQVINLTPDQLRGFSPAQVASLSAAEIAYFDARQLEAIGIVPKAETSVPPAIATSNQLPLNFEAPSDSPNKFQAAIPVMTDVAGAGASAAAATPRAAVATQAAATPTTASTQPLAVAPVVAAAPKTGVLPITILSNAEARPTTAGVAFEQDASGVKLRITSAPPTAPTPPVTGELAFNDKLTTFMVSAANGDVVEFLGSLVNKRLVIVATTSVAKQVARTELNMVLAAAITSLGAENRVMLASLDGVVLDLR